MAILAGEALLASVREQDKEVSMAMNATLVTARIRVSVM